MNNVSQKFFIVLASAALLFAGCSKKPVRPNPGDTVLGPGAGGSGDRIPSENLPGGELGPRPEGFGMNGEHNAFESIYFDFNETSIKPAERAKLAHVKEYIEKNPGAHVVLEGHCDWRGTAEYNLGLGDRRAGAVKKYLGTIGVGADKLETLSKGSLDAAKNGDEGTMAKDRRVDVLIAGAK